MGEYADMAIEAALDAEMRVGDYLLRKPVRDLSTWKCLDGRIIKLVDMEDSHLLNCIAMMRRKGSDKSTPMIEAMLAELAGRGVRRTPPT